MAEEVRNRHVLPFGLVGVGMRKDRDVQVIETSLAEAKRLRTQLETDLDTDSAAEKRTWFFREFDDDFLIFFIAKYEPGQTPGRRPWGTYVVERLLRVPRSREAEEELGIGEVVSLYEVGRGGIKGGMSQEEVVQLLGEPQQREALGPFGAYDLIYEKLRVRFLDEEVAALWEL
jgi:hypothetical protein